jgi:lactate permease
MHTPPFSVLYWLLALSPIIVVLILMIGFRWGGAKAGPVGWLTALVVSLAFFGATPRLLAYSQLKGLLLTVYVLYIIWMALVLYHVVNEAGAIAVIGRAISRLTGDRVMQLLILSWVFSAFLQGVAGFGVPIAVVAPLLIGMGFEPVTAVVATAIGHSWSVTFGDIASSFQALIAATGLNGLELAPWSALFLGLACFGCGLAAAHAHSGLKGLWHGLPAVLIIGTLMSGTQYLLATNGLWNPAGFVAGLVGLLAGAAVARLPFYHSPSATSRAIQSSVREQSERRLSSRRRIETKRAGLPRRPAWLRYGSPLRYEPTQPALPRKPNDSDATSTADCVESRLGLPLALAPYLFLIVLVTAAELYGPLHQLLNSVVIVIRFPELHTAYGWITEAGTGRTVSIFGHAGALLAYTSAIGYLLYRRAGLYSEGILRKIASNTLRSAVPSSIGIASLVGMALVMDHSGMTHLLAQGISRSVGAAFPLFSPLIGVLGAFMTGSNTNSNVIFAPLQKQAAELIGISVFIILGAQTTGGSLGSMLAPAKVIVGCSTAGLAGREGEVLKRTLLPGLLIAACVGVVAWLAVYFGGSS